MTEIILRRIGDNTYKEPSSPEKAVEAKIQPPAVIGRGPTIKCPEKKVSRNHALIDWDDEGIVITSIHMNPTFVIIDGKEKILSRGQTAVLNNGDRFGLLKEAYWYKVILNSTSDEKSVSNDSSLSSNDRVNCVKINGLNNQEDVDAEAVKLTKNKTVDLTDDSVSNSLKNNSNLLQKEEEDTKNEIEHVSSETVEDSNKIENKKEDVQKDVMEVEDEDIPEDSSSSSYRERVLPDWMTKPKASKGEPSVKASGTSAHGGKKPRTAKPPQPKPKPQQQKLHECSDDSEEDQSSPKKATKARKTSPQKQKASPKKPNQYHSLSQDFDASDSDTEIPTKSPTKVSPAPKKASPRKPNKATTKKPNQYHSVSQDVNAPDSDAEIDAEIKSVDKVQTKNVTAVGKDHHSVSDDDEDEGPVKNEQSPKKSANEDEDSKGKEKKKGVKTPRKSCEYGEECYRKNAKHRKEMAHPGDMDYVSDQDMTDVDVEDDRPECEYGLTCYRKNSQHRQSFKHTKKPQPPRNAKRKAKGKGYGDDDSENDYDFDDPFLNDDSSDDYAPTDSSGGDSDFKDAVEEDTKRTLKEGKKFVKKQRP